MKRKLIKVTDEDRWARWKMEEKEVLLIPRFNMDTRKNVIRIMKGS